MTQYSQAIVTANGGNSYTRNLSVGDTIVVTGTTAENNNSRSASVSPNNPVTVSASEIDLDGSDTVTISTNANGNYSVLFAYTNKEIIYTATISGTVSGYVVDTTPNAFTFPDVANAAPGSSWQRRVQITGINTPATVSGTGLFLVKGDAGYPNINSSSYTTANKTISNNSYVFAKLTASSSNGTAVNNTITVGGVSDTFTVSTPGGTSGGSSATVQPGTPGTNTHGIAIYGPNHSTEVVSVNLRASNLAVFSTFSIAAGSSQTFLCNAANDTSKVLVIATASYQG